MIILYNRRALCAGDDVYNGIYKLDIPDDALLWDLIGVLLNGGCGNTWEIPQTSETGWEINSNIGRLAVISADKKTIEYLDKPEYSKLSELGIKWVFGEREGDQPDISQLTKRFEKYYN